MKRLYDNFIPVPAAHWRRFVVGRAMLETGDNRLRLMTVDAQRQGYSNAELDDANDLPRSSFHWQPPLRLTLRARFSHPTQQLRGTAGFGFWNHPVAPGYWPVLPRAIWFFHGSQPGDIKLDSNTPGWGWKATTIDTLRPSALALLPLAPVAALLMNIPALYRRLWPPIQQAVRVQEQLLDSAMDEWHIYTLDWGTEVAHFFVDGQPVLLNAPSPRGPLCFVAWVDNQYAIVKPWGRFGWGLLDVPGQQWLDIEWLAIE
ncbi:MAG: hypothetical protein HC914_01760 [Chloroflexaceae bacterium]|nr:hypothetical protein [Chloroflexaceae bacterium]